MDTRRRRCRVRDPQCRSPASTSNPTRSRRHRRTRGVRARSASPVQPRSGRPAARDVRSARSVPGAPRAEPTPSGEPVVNDLQRDGPSGGPADPVDQLLPLRDGRAVNRDDTVAALKSGQRRRAPVEDGVDNGRRVQAPVVANEPTLMTSARITFIVTPATRMNSRPMSGFDSNQRWSGSAWGRTASSR